MSKIINRMEICHLYDDNENPHAPVSVSREVLNYIETKDEIEFFKKACDYLENVENLLTCDAKIRDVFLKELKDLDRKFKP